MRKLKNNYKYFEKQKYIKKNYVKNNSVRNTIMPTYCPKHMGHHYVWEQICGRQVLESVNQNSTFSMIVQSLGPLSVRKA